jgi:type I restriction enzyme, S subunit
MEKVRIGSLITDKFSGEWGQEPLGDDAVKVLRTANFTNSGVISYHDVVKREIVKKIIDKKQLFDGDIIIEKSGGSPTQPVGRVVYFEKPNEEIFLCNNFTAILRPDLAKVSPKYLFYLLYNAYNTQRVLEFQNKTTGIINLQLERYLDSEIYYEPDLETQNKIVAILDKAKVILDKREKTIAKYDELLRAVFLEMFGDPVINEKGFDTSLLEELFSANPRLGTTTPVSKDGRTPVVRVGELGGFKILFEKCQKANLSQPELDRFLIKENDILIARAIGSIDHLGKASLVQEINEDVIFDSHVMRLQFNQEKISSYYFYNWLRSKGGRRLFMDKSSKSAVQYNINGAQISQIRISIPPINLQNEFKARCIKIEKIIENLSRSKEKIETLINSLSQLVFKGELKFNTAVDLEILLENDYDFFKKNSNSKSIQLLLNRLVKSELNENKFYEKEIYDKAKSFVFELLKEGRVKQVFDEKTKGIKLAM